MITKYVSLSFDEAHESFIETFFKKMKIKVKPIKKFDEAYYPLTHEENVEGLRSSIQQVNAAMRGEIKLKTAREFLEEPESDEASKQKQLQPV